MIIDRNKNSSILAVSAICLIIGQGMYSNSTYCIPKINREIYSQDNSIPKLVNMVPDNSNLKLNESYINNKKDDSMINNMIKSVNLVSIKRMEDSFDDLGYYENNEVEYLGIAPRNTVRVKAKIKTVKRADMGLM